jgi:hypothetical protein
VVRAPMCDRAPSCVVETVIEAKIGYRGCEGCFCYIATRRAEGDHYVDLNFKEGVVEPKIQPRAINSAQGLMGYFQKVF